MAVVVPVDMRELAYDILFIHSVLDPLVTWQLTKQFI
jgi:hypothetical protein